VNTCAERVDESFLFWVLNIGNTVYQESSWCRSFTISCIWYIVTVLCAFWVWTKRQLTNDNNDPFCNKNKVIVSESKQEGMTVPVASLTTWWCDGGYICYYYFSSSYSVCL